MGEQTINPPYLSMNILARDKVLYHGHAIAAVVATSPHIAEEALALIKVDYELLPPVLDVRKAMQARPGICPSSSGFQPEFILPAPV